MNKQVLALFCVLGFTALAGPAAAVDGFPKATMAKIHGATW